MNQKCTNKKFKIGCIGIGAMGGALIKAAIKKIGGDSVIVSCAHTDKAANFAKDFSCASGTNNEVLSLSEIIFIAVKPAIVPSILKEANSVFNAFSENEIPTIVSMAAGIKIETISSLIEKPLSVIRIMPNMPALVGAGMTGLSASSNTTNEEVKNVSEILSESGLIEQCNEDLMDAVTAVSGSGPAFCFMFIEAMADAAVKCGMPRKQALIYAAQTLKGSAETVLNTSTNPAVLKDSVCSPKGTTIAGVAKLEELGFRNSVIQAVTAAYDRSVELGKK